MGKNIMMSSDCKSCHKVNEKSIGPSFTQVAQKYKNDSKASTYLIQKVIKGGAGVWGEVAMPAHPTMKEGDVKQITTWVLSLANSKVVNKSLPQTGMVMPKQPADKPNTMFALTASYTDLGGAGIGPLASADRIILRSNSIDVRRIRTMTGFTSKDSAGNRYLMFPLKEGSLKVNKVDLTAIKTVQLTGFSNGVTQAAYTVNIRANDAIGNVIGQGKLSMLNNKQLSLSIPISPQQQGKMQDIFIVIKADGPVNGNLLLKAIRFNQ